MVATPTAAVAFGEPARAAMTVLPGYSCTGSLALAAHGVAYVLAVNPATGISAVFKTKSDGTLDGSWGIGGRADLPAAAFVDNVAPLADGSVPLVGCTVVKLRPDGSMDLSYDGNGNGHAFDNFLAPDTFATQPDGGIVL